MGDLYISLENLEQYNESIRKYLRGMLNGKYNYTDISLLGVPTAPTAPTGTENNQIATTAYVVNTIERNFNLFSHYKTKYDFPNVGDTDHFFIDDSTGDMYLYGVNGNGTYTSVGTASGDTLYGGSADA